MAKRKPILERIETDLAAWSDDEFLASWAVVAKYEYIGQDNTRGVCYRWAIPPDADEDTIRGLIEILKGFIGEYYG